MTRRRLSGYALVAVTSLVFGFLGAAQLRAQLLTPSNTLARNQALVRTVSDLERQNAGYRSQITSLRGQDDALEAEAAQRSASTLQLQSQVADLRMRAGLTALHGPGVSVDLAGGRPGAAPATQSGWTIDFQDVEDVVQALYAGGAEGVSVNGRRITPASSFAGSGTAVVIDSGPPMSGSFHVVAIGNRNGMEQELADPSVLGDLRNRQRLYGVQLSWTGSPDLSLPAYDLSLEVTYARPT